MPATIKIKNSSTASAVPTSSDLVQGELAVNVTDRRIFTENASGTVVELGTNPTILTMGAAGSASAPVITRTGDTNTGIFFPAADTIAFAEGGVEAMRLDSSGNMGVGLTSPSHKIHASGGGSSVCNLQLTYDALGTTLTDGVQFGIQSGGAYIWNWENSALYFGTNNSERMRLDASGNLGVGTTSPVYKLDVSASSGNGIRYTATSTSATIYMGDNSGTPFLSTGTNSPLTFGTQSTERARIDSSGNLLVGGTSGGTGKLRVIAASDSYASGGSIALVNTAGNYWNALTTGTGASNNLYLGYNASDRGYFSSSTGAYTSVSDQRLKKNISNIQYGLNVILELRSVSYNMNDQEDTDTKALGFIAQEVMQIVPEAVSEMQGGMYGMDKVALVPVLVKAIQEQQAIINAQQAALETLTNRITALEQA